MAASGPTPAVNRTALMRSASERARDGNPAPRTLSEPSMNAEATIPGPKGRFFTGPLKEARERPLAFMLEVARDYGDVVQLRVGPLRLVVIRHPDHIKRVLQERNTAYGRPAFVSMVRRIVGNGLLFSEGETWLRQRRTM